MCDKKSYQYSYWHNDPETRIMYLQIVKVQLTEKELLLEQIKNPQRDYVLKSS